MTSHQTNHMLSGLQAGEAYSISIRMVTSKGDSPWSDRISAVSELMAIEQIHNNEQTRDTLKKELGISNLFELSSKSENMVSAIEKEVQMQVAVFKCITSLNLSFMCHKSINYQT